MHLTGMDIKDTPPFTDLVELDFDARVNLFIGPNASGKSSILREMNAALNDDRLPDSDFRWLTWRKDYNRRGLRAYVSWFANREEDRKWDSISDHDVLLFTSDDWPGKQAGTSGETTPPVVYIGSVRTSLPELYDDGASNENDADVSEVLNSQFSGANFKLVNEKMYQKADAMFQQENSDDTPSEERRAYRIHEAIDIVYPCVRAICTEILADTGTGPRNYVTGLLMEELDYYTSADLDSINIHRAMGINTIDQPNFSNVRPEDRPNYSDAIGQAPLYAGFLSSGTQTTFLWVRWLAYKMLHHYDFAEGWQNEPAILLIDEIENHLHPTWQRRVIPALLEHFPGLQIFATTHSPFVVAGLRAGQVHLLDRNSEGVVTATTTEQDIIGWTTDEILRSFMGVAEPTDELTIQRTKRLRELRRKESRTDEEAEELETLRRQVNADLLSSRSPMEQQQERYADMMLRFIESRQSQLSQDS